MLLRISYVVLWCWWQACKLKLEDPQGALTDCEYAMQTGVDNVKALFRQGQVIFSVWWSIIVGFVEKSWDHLRFVCLMHYRFNRYQISHIIMVNNLQFLKHYSILSIWQAHMAMGDIDSALMSLTKASNIEPNDRKWIRSCLGHSVSTFTYNRIAEFCHDKCLCRWSALHKILCRRWYYFVNLFFSHPRSKRLCRFWDVKTLTTVLEYLLLGNILLEVFFRIGDFVYSHNTCWWLLIHIFAAGIKRELAAVRKKVGLSQPISFYLDGLSNA